MRKLLKYIIKRFCLGRVTRGLRAVSYSIFDAAGYAIFFVLRKARLLPEIKPFEPGSVRKILVIRADRIGDLVLSTPAIRAVRETFPRANLHLLVSDYAKDLVINNVNINKLLIDKKDKPDTDYDLAIALHPGIRQNYTVFKSGAKFRFGYSGWGGAFFLTRKIEDDREKRIRHEVESALEIAGLAGCRTRNKELEVSVTEQGEKFAEEFFKANNLSGKVVFMHPGARQEHIRWRKDGFAKVADRLIKEAKVSLILSVGDKEKQLAGDIAFLMQERPVFLPAVRLTELVSLIKKCSLYLGNITGPMHIACALKVPVVAITGVINPADNYRRWGPWGQKHTTVNNPNINCVNCQPTDCKDFSCIRSISEDSVFECVKKYFE